MGHYKDGVRGLKLGQDGLGQAFVDFQKAIKKVAQEGTLLAIWLPLKNSYLID